MKKVFMITFCVCLLFFCGCEPMDKKPYSFYQSPDQIQTIEILQSDTNYAGLEVPVIVVDSLPVESFGPLVAAFTAIDGAYSPYSGTYLGAYAIRISYQDGTIELLYSGGSVCRQPNGDTDYSTYYFGDDEFYAILSRFSDISIVLPE